ncbi:MAG: carbon-monoxide dehydrogenase small subunit [Chloroflexi bacterium]|nr:MAG: carbon-monoxide dehydrogenase small subunit [Chloroflexota bacterium]
MPKIRVSFIVNQEPVEILAEPWQTLMDALRENLRLTGTKEGCGNGNCGACTVMLNGKAIDSCCMLAAEAEGQNVTTVEGLANGEQLDPLQQAFIDFGALQCGFCTPGFLVSARAFLNENPNPSEQDIRFAIAGNLCRCTGYDKIVRAIQHVADSGH